MRIPTPVAVGVGLSTIALYSVSAVPLATPASAADSTKASASTSAEVLHLTTLAVPGTGTLADAGIGGSTGSVDGTDRPRTTAAAANLGGALADQALPDLLAVSDQKAPHDHLSPSSETSGAGEIPGLASLGISTTTAQARWTGDDSCPAPGVPLTRSSVSTADVTTADAGGAGALVKLPGTVSTEQATKLVGSGSRKVVSTARGSAADVDLLGGQLEVGVTDAPVLTAVATGADGGAKVSWSAPVVTVTANGEKQELPADGSPVDFTSPDNPLLHVELSVGQLTDVTEAGDGTTASGSASVLHVHASLGGQDLGATVLDTDLFPLRAAATAPVGGVRCGSGSQDADGDGLTNAEETSGSANGAYGHESTDPGNSDSDGDGLSDGDELTGAANDAFGSAPSDPNRTDTDGDHIGDGVETTGSANTGFGNQATDPTAADTDGDGLQDGREIRKTATDPNVADTDHGSVNDGDELLAGTDPNNPADDVPSGDGPTPDDPNDPDGDGLSNQEEVQEGTNPVDPDTDGDGLSDGDEVNQFETAPDDPDTDGDRLTDGRETSRTGTDPNVRDTDHDGLNDGREVLDEKTDPTRKDTDGDGLGDGREVKHVKTDPNRKDTDGDSLWDGDEVNGPAKGRYPDCRTVPTRKDTDRDGLGDGRELKHTDTDPCDADSDDGGVSDGKEVQAGSDPNDPHSTPKNPRGNASLSDRLLGRTG